MDFPNKPCHISDQIHHPFTAGPFLANPLQEINIVLIGDQKRLFQHQIIVGRGVMVLEGTCLGVAQNKTKRQVDFKDRGLISKDPAQLFAEAGRVDRRQAEFVPILKSVVAAKSGTDLSPVLPVCVRNIFVRAWNKVWRDKNWICIPARTHSSRRHLRSGWWFWRCIRTCLGHPLRFFRSWCIIWSRSAAFMAVCLFCCWWAVWTCVL